MVPLKKVRHGIRPSYASYLRGCECVDCVKCFLDKCEADRNKSFSTGPGHRVSEAVCGTINKYKRGCRCADCKAASAEHTKAWRDRRVPKDTSRMKHGALYTYECGCRCDECKKTMRRVSQERYREKKKRAGQ